MGIRDVQEYPAIALVSYVKQAPYASQFPVTSVASWNIQFSRVKAHSYVERDFFKIQNDAKRLVYLIILIHQENTFFDIW